MWQHRGYTENCLCKQGNIVIRYIEVDFTFGLPDYVRYIEEFVISRFYSIHFTVTNWPGHKISFVISRTSWNEDLILLT